MAQYIIADLHLSELRPEMLTAFSNFVSNTLTHNDSLIILGDLFDYWVGRDKDDKAQQAVRDTLGKARAERGIKTYFLRGNRDFLISHFDAAWLNMTLLPDLHIIQTVSGATLLMHGDLLCTNDLKYQKFRKRSRSRLLRTLFLALPLTVRRRIARKARLKSQARMINRLDPKIYGVTTEGIRKYLAATKCSNIVHGHIHFFARYVHEVAGENTRLSLGKWGRTYSFVRTDLNGTALIEKRIDQLIDAREYPHLDFERYDY